MKAACTLAICGLEYVVIFATADEVPELLENEGFTALNKNKIFIRAGMPRSRMRDTLVHEISHAFFESSGIGSFLKDSISGDYDKFEETLIRLVTPALIRLVEDNGGDLINVPLQFSRPKPPVMAQLRATKKRAR